MKRRAKTGRIAGKGRNGKEGTSTPTRRAEAAAYFAATRRVRTTPDGRYYISVPVEEPVRTGALPPWGGACLPDTHCPRCGTELWEHRLIGQYCPKFNCVVLDPAWV